MCRILCVSGRKSFLIRPHLEVFSDIAQHSREYQGHGWGCSWLSGDGWHHYHDIRPIWEDPQRDFGETTVFLAHARSAFRDEGIEVANNMPFFDDEHVFIFNGELQGVRIKEQGRIGAEKIFNYIKRFDKGDTFEALKRALGVIQKKTRYVRALNVIMASRQRIYSSCLFGESPEYFQLQCIQRDGLRIICSRAYPGETNWQPIDNGDISCHEVGS
jgi:predicted glutamine amidotransferase